MSTLWFERPTMPRLWKRAGHRAVTPERVARAVAGAIERPRLAVFVPWSYRLLPLIAGLSPSLAMRLVRSGSMPPKADADPVSAGPCEPSDACDTLRSLDPERACITRSR